MRGCIHMEEVDQRKQPPRIGRIEVQGGTHKTSNQRKRCLISELCLLVWAICTTQFDRGRQETRGKVVVGG